MGEGSKIAVLGAGSWGTALALALCRNGHSIKLWAHRREQVMQMRTMVGNPGYLPGIVFPAEIEPVENLAQAVGDADELLAVVPSHAFAGLCRQLGSVGLDAGKGFAWATKGLSPDGQRFLHDEATELVGERPLAMISGPSFAREVAMGLPTALTVASADQGFADRWAALLHGESTRAYTSSDLVGVEVCGAVKNLLAIAAGISDGLGFGANARAALISRGLVEMARLGEAVGASAETFSGLAGLGDLVLTCTDDQSRNRRAGLALAEGHSRDQIQQQIGQVVEGIRSVAEVRALAARLEVEMPITEQVYQVVHQRADPLEAVRSLLTRQLRAE